MARSALRVCRINAFMTKQGVADAVGVSLPIYERWEASGKVPKGRVKALASTLNCTKDDILGLQPLVSLFPFPESKPEYTYFGEVSIQFSASKAIVLPITEAERLRIVEFVWADEDAAGYLCIRTLDNRIVFVRKGAIADLYLSSDACDEFGPEDDFEPYLGVFTDPDYWRIAKDMNAEWASWDDYRQNNMGVVDRYGKEKVKAVYNSFYLDYDTGEKLLRQGDLTEADKDSIENNFEAEAEARRTRISETIVKIGGKKARRLIFDDCEGLFDAFHSLEESAFMQGAPSPFLHLSTEGYHQTVLVNLHKIDYISIPLALYEEGRLSCYESELDHLDGN